MDDNGRKCIAADFAVGGLDGDCGKLRYKSVGLNIILKRLKLQK